MHAAGRHGTAEVARRERPVDRDAVPACPTCGKIRLHGRQREDAAAVRGTEVASLELVGDGEASGGSGGVERADSDADAPERGSASFQRQRAVREINLELQRGARVTQPAGARVDPDDAIPGDAWLRDREPASPPGGDNTERPL